MIKIKVTTRKGTIEVANAFKYNSYVDVKQFVSSTIKDSIEALKKVK